MCDEIVKALRLYAEESPEAKLLNAAADAIEKLIAEVDHKDKAIQGFLTQIERFSAETSTLQNRIEHQNATIDSLYKTIEKLTEQKEKGNE